MSSSASVGSNSYSNAGEGLYLDARDKEQRMRMRKLSTDDIISKKINAKKINNKSEHIVRNKLVYIYVCIETYSYRRITFTCGYRSVKSG